jgi:NTE family protein
VAKLRAFWEGVSANTASWTDMLPHLAGITMLRGALNHLAAGHALFTGVPGFFYPRWLPPFLSPTHTADATSWYDTSPIRSTLESLIDFDRINAGLTRFSVGAVNVRSGNFAYFDNAVQTIRAEHIMASARCRRAFRGGGGWRVLLGWRHGIEHAARLGAFLAFRAGYAGVSGGLVERARPLPSDMTSVAVRMKEIQFSSRTRAATDTFRQQQQWRGLPAAGRNHPARIAGRLTAHAGGRQRRGALQHRADGLQIAHL